MWASIEEANKELKKALQLPECYLHIVGPETIVRSKAEIQENLTPGKYTVTWYVPDDSEEGKFRIGVQNTIEITTKPAIETEAPLTSTSDPLAIAQLLARDRIADRESFYNRMMELQNSARKELEVERAEQRRQAQEEQREWLKMQREAMREFVRDISPAREATKVEDEESLLSLLTSIMKDKEYEGLRQTVAPAVRMFIAKAITKAGGMDVPVVSE